MTTPFKEGFKKLCISLGKNNKALYGALTIAFSKGILRPTFTMMDKKQDRESRKYTAFREGLTGAVAFVTYLMTDKVVENLTKHIAQKTNHMKDLNKMKSTISLINVSLTALFVIPTICNLTTKPLMNVLIDRKKNSTPLAPSQQRPLKHVNFGGYPQYYPPKDFNGMRIGGI